MGKITVKHYLNKNINPKTGNNNSSLYPLYVQIIYNKYTTSKRSKSEILMTEKGFDYYNKTKKILENEVKEDKLLSVLFRLDKEIIDIENSLKIIDKWNLTIKGSNLFKVTEEFSKDVAECFSENFRKDIYINFQIDSETKEKVNTEYEEFLLSFSGNIIESIERIERYTKIDIKKFLKKESILAFDVLKLVSKIKEEYKRKHKRSLSFAEFVCMDYESIFKELLKKETLEYYSEMINTINKMINNFVEQETILYLDYNK